MEEKASSKDFNQLEQDDNDLFNKLIDFDKSNEKLSDLLKPDALVLGESFNEIGHLANVRFNKSA